MSLLFLFFLLSLPASLYSGHIFSQPMTLIYQNPQACWQCFKLIVPVLFETPIMNGEYISITFPFSIALANTVTVTISSMYFSQQGEFSLGLAGGTDPEYIVQANGDIPANVWINFTIYLEDASSFTAGVKGCLQMKTQSSLTNPILYDSSPCLDTLALAAQSDSTTFSVSGSYASADAVNINAFAASYRAFLDVTPNAELIKGGLFFFSMYGRFTFDYPCVNTQCTAGGTDCPTDIALLNSTYKCDIRDNGQTLYFKVDRNVTKTTFRVAFTVKNPNYYISNQDADSIAVTFQSAESIGYIHGYLPQITGAGTNPLSFYTAYPTVTMAFTQKLFWGLLPQSDTSAAGCPMTLYAMNSKIPVYNNLRTEFTVSLTFQSFKENSYLRVFWTLINGGTTFYTTALANSFSTNLPVAGTGIQAQFPMTNDTLVVDNIGSMQTSTTYYLSIRFLISSTAKGQTLKTGAVEIHTTAGAGEETLIPYTGINLLIRSNREYLDNSAATGWFYAATGVQPTNYYNFMYSYRQSDYTLTGSISTVYATINTAFFSTTSKVGVFTKPTGSSDLYNLFVVLYAPICKLCKDGFITTGATMCACSITGTATSSGASNGLHVLLKLVFNNNILNIDPSLFAKGVLPVGNLFSNAAMSVTACSGYDTAGTQGTTLNLIVASSDALGTPFHHVSLVCKQGASVDICHSISGRTAAPTISGLAFVNVTISTFPTLYADTFVFDMILCFKAMPYASFATYSTMLESYFTLYEDTVNEGGPGVLPGYVVAGGPPTGSIASYANYYKLSTTYGNANYIASYLRVTVAMPVNTVPGAFLGVFINDNTLAGLQQFADAGNVVNCVEMAGGVQVPGALLPGADSALSNDFWWQHKGVAISKAVAQGSTYSFYIPMKISSNVISSLYFAVMNKSTATTTPTFGFSAVYRLVGSAYGAALKQTFTGSNVITPFLNLGASYTTDTTAGCMTTGSVLPKLYPGSSVIKPYNTITNFGFSSDLGTAGTGTNCARGLNSGSNWGAIFAVYARTRIFSAANVVTWDYAGTNINKCVFHSFPSPLDASKSTLISTLLCSLDSGSNVPPISTSKNLYLDKLTIPFYWGSGFLISPVLQYIWSLPSGLGVSMILDPTVTTSWVESACSVSAITSVPLNSKDVFFALSIKNVAKYDLPASDSNLVVTQSITAGVASLNLVQCFHSYLLCSYTATGIYTLTNPSADTPFPVTPGTLSLTVLLDTPPTFTSTTHFATIKYKALVTEKCSDTAPAGFGVTGGAVTAPVVLNGLQYVNMTNARGAFSFAFGLNRNMRQGNEIVLNLGFLAGGLSSSYQCQVLNSDFNTKSHQFLSIDSTDTSNVKLVIRNEIVGGGSFGFRCSGGAQSPTGTSQTSLSASYVRTSDGTTVASSTQTIPFTAIPAEIKMTTAVSLTKRFLTHGFEADYLFSFKPVTLDIDLTGRIYIEFSSGIPTGFNPSGAGAVECYLNAAVVYCERSAERRLSVTPNIPLLKNTTSNYQLLIVGISNPDVKDSNWQVYFALDNNTTPYDGIIEHVYLTEPAIDATVIAPLYIKDLVLSHHVARKPLSIELDLQFPANMINSGSYLYIQLPKSFKESFQLPDSLSCSVTRFGDANFTELTSSFKKYYNRRIRMFVTDAANTVAQVYRVSINGLISPQQITQFEHDLVKVYLTLDDIKIFASTVNCLRNTTELLTFPVASSSSIELDFWDPSSLQLTTQIDVYQGSYRTFLALGPRTGNFPYTFKWQFVNPANSSFYINPPVIPINVGAPISSFAIATDNLTIPGIYLLTAQKLNGTGGQYSDIPALQVRVRTEPCQLSTDQSLYIVPYGGRSAPIVIDFSSCLPVDTLDLTANVTNGFNNYYISVENSKITTKTLNFSAYNTPKQLIFHANSYSMNPLTGSPMALINFTVTGINGNAYLPPRSVQIQVVDNTPFQTPPVPMDPTVSASIGSVQLQIGCDQLGTLYYGVGVGNSTVEAGYLTM